MLGETPFFGSILACTRRLGQAGGNGKSRVNQGFSGDIGRIARVTGKCSQN